MPGFQGGSLLETGMGIKYMLTSITYGCCSAEMRLELATWNVDIGSNVETVGDALGSAW